MHVEAEGFELALGRGFGYALSEVFADASMGAFADAVYALDMDAARVRDLLDGFTVEEIEQGLGLERGAACAEGERQERDAFLFGDLHSSPPFETVIGDPPLESTRSFFGGSLAGRLDLWDAYGGVFAESSVRLFDHVG